MYKYYDQFRINEIKNLIYAKKFDNAENKINKYKKEFPNDELIGVYEAKLLIKELIESMYIILLFWN